MLVFNPHKLATLQHLYKINLINSISGVKSANLIGSISTNNHPNVAVFSSVIHLGSEPPLLGFVVRPTTVPRNTYQNIKDTKYYTINAIHQDIIKDAHHTSAKYPFGVSEFEQTQLKEEYKAPHKVPFVKDAPVQILMKYINEYAIKENNTLLIVGEIKELYLKEDILQPDGYVNLTKGNVVGINGLDGYVATNLMERFPYQRPKKTTSK